MKTNQPVAIRRQDYTPFPFEIESVSLEFDLKPEATRVTNRMTVTRKQAGAADRLALNGDDLKLISVTVDGRKLKPSDYSLSDEFLTLTLPGDTAAVEIETEINPQANTQLMGLYISNGTFCTQCEAEAFRRITFYPDRPDVLSVFRVRMEADKQAFPVLLSNGNPVETGDAAHGRHWAVWDDPHPKPAYLFALVAGQLDVRRDSFTTASGKDVDLNIWVRSGDLDKVDYAMWALKRSMIWDEQVYGCEYDLDEFNIVAVSDFNMGAMENKGLNVFNTKYVLANRDAATDFDFQGVAAVIAHEYFHNWTGNRVTCRDWFQLSLKEGLTVFRDQQFSEDHFSPAVERIGQVQNLRATQFVEDSGPLAHPIRPDSYIEIDNFYTATVYEKGAEIVRMMHTLLGPDAWRKANDLYFERHDGQAVTCEDYVRAMEDASGRDLAQFRLWYSQAGTPEITASGQHDAQAQTYTLTLHQHVPDTPNQKNKKPMHIPVRLGLIGPDGHDIPLRLEAEAEAMGSTCVLDLTEATQSFVFADVAEPPVPSLFRGFSAPIKLTSDVTDQALAFQLAHDSDSFNRWEAGQELATRILLKMISGHQSGTELSAMAEIFQPLIEAYTRVLDTEGLDPALVSLALTLPGEGGLAQRMEVVDPDAIHAARMHLRQVIGQALAAALANRYEALSVTGDYAPEAQQIGQRSLRNTCLAYLVAGGCDHARAVARQQYAETDNMTDRKAALSVLVNDRGSDASAELLAFHDRFKADDLVIDGWFALQAGAEGSGLPEVEALIARDDFTWKNPNRVRSVIGAFVRGNQVGFHKGDGSGYRFLADAVIRLNGLNPSIAATALTPFRTWRRYDPTRQALIRAELERILAEPKLAKGVFEVASKTLGA
ncbi:MAG: aminopeptidase N [Alphaproteobacteria bacterium]